jgi:hypothetical protein
MKTKTCATKTTLSPHMSFRTRCRHMSEAACRLREVHTWLATAATNCHLQGMFVCLHTKLISVVYLSRRSRRTSRQALGVRLSRICRSSVYYLIAAPVDVNGQCAGLLVSVWALSLVLGAKRRRLPAFELGHRTMCLR